MTIQPSLYLGMFDQVNTYSRKDIKRARKKRLMDRVAKTLLYGAAILTSAVMGDNFVEHATIGTAVCAALECFR